MCGIAGIHCRGDVPVADLNKAVQEMLLGLEGRGRDASGWITLTDDGQARLRKDVLPASRFVARMRSERKRWGIADGRTVRTAMVHTRFATVGNKRDARNAHPHVSSTIAAVHNGTVYNADELFESFDLPRRATVDSEVVPALIEEMGWDNVKDALSLLDGGAALGLISQQHPRELVLARVHDFPMHYVVTRDYVMWASTPEVLRRGYKAATGNKLKAKIESLGDGEMVVVTKGVVTTTTFPTLRPARARYVPTYTGTPRAGTNIVQTRREAARQASGYTSWDEVPQEPTSGYDRVSPWYDDREVDILELMADGLSRKLATEIVDESIEFMQAMAEDDRVARHGTTRGTGERKGHVETKSPATLAMEALDRRERKA